MYTVLHPIRILVALLLINNACCQDGYSDRDILRMQQQMASNDGQMETISSYSTNVIQRDPNSQSVSSVSFQYHLADETEKNDDYNRADRGRTRKVYRIKNPFHRQLNDNSEQSEGQADPQDSGTGASNQYAAMQYSLPPEDFLQQMRAESQYIQQQSQQLSTQASSLGYSATPQPQYQYSTPSNYDNNNQQSNQVPQHEQKISHSQSYHPNSNSYQYNLPSGYVLDGVQSTSSPVPPYLSTSYSNDQYVGTASNQFVSNASPLYLSSPSNTQQYVSSPLSVVQTGSPDYSNNRVTTTMGSGGLNYETHEGNKKMQIDHFDNSLHGVRYPGNQQQYQNEYPSSTPAPSSSPYADAIRDPWQNSINSPSPVSKSLQEVSLSQFQNYPYSSNQENRGEVNLDSVNSDVHRVGNIPAANNVFLNFAQPEYQALSNMKSRERDLDQESSQSDYYSHGDYGWKLLGKKLNLDTISPNGYMRYQGNAQNNDDRAVSHMSFHMDTSKPYASDQISKSGAENVDAQEFAKAAAKAHEYQKQQQQQQLQQQQYLGNNFPGKFNELNPLSSASTGSAYYGAPDKQKNKLYEIPNAHIYNGSPQDLITASPFYYNSRDNNLESKQKQPFDHAKALKNIVPIDVSNVVPNSDSAAKLSGFDSNRYNLQNYNKESVEQNMKMFYKPIPEPFYKDKNSLYGYNLKSKPDDFINSDGVKSLGSNNYYLQPQSQDSYFQSGLNDNKRYIDQATQSLNFIPQTPSNYQDSHQQGSISQHGQVRSQSPVGSDITSILKLNDIPYRLQQGLSPESLRLNNFDQGGLPTALPMRLNQNVGSHQIDVATNILNKLLLNKLPNPNVDRPEIDPQTGGLIANINGFKVANPFNVDLKLVAEMLKGKPALDETHMVSLRDQFNKPSPIKLDFSQLQNILLKNDNTGSMAPLNDGLSVLGNPYLELYSGRFPYQGVKYSRSQEEEESIVPIADSSNTHPIGAVMEQNDPGVQEIEADTDLTAHDDTSSNHFDDERPTHLYGGSRPHLPDRHRHPNSLYPGRHSFLKKYPKSNEPYPLLKPPPVRSKSSRNKFDKHGRRRRLNRPKVMRILKAEPLFASETEEEVHTAVPTLLRPPPRADLGSDAADQQDEP